ncbi:MAG: hypothetical protein RLO15_05230 [Parvibaculum sp.]
MSETAMQIEGMARNLQRAIGEITLAYASVDSSVSEILTLHLFVEQQLDEVLAQRLTRPEQIGRFSFGHKVSLLKALWNHERIDHAAVALLAFNDIRNALAHNDIKASATARVKLATKLSEIAEEGTVEPTDRLELMAIILLSLLHLAIYDVHTAHTT